MVVGCLCALLAVCLLLAHRNNQLRELLASLGIVAAFIIPMCVALAMQNYR